MPKTYTVKEVADILGFSTNSIYTFLKEKRIKGVRIGRGRFRIPEQELSRVLHLSKKPQSPSSVAQGAGEQVTPAQGNEETDSSLAIHAKDVISPNLFDWFTGLAAIASGLALFLFNSSLVRPEING